MPFSNIRTLEDALEVVRMTDEPNCGLLIDIRHTNRGSISLEDIAKVAERYISAVELNEADKEVVGLLWQGTIYNRKLPVKEMAERTFDATVAQFKV